MIFKFYASSGLCAFALKNTAVLTVKKQQLVRHRVWLKISSLRKRRQVKIRRPLPENFLHKKNAEK